MVAGGNELEGMVMVVVGSGSSSDGREVVLLPPTFFFFACQTTYPKIPWTEQLRSPRSFLSPQQKLNQ